MSCRGETIQTGNLPSPTTAQLDGEGEMNTKKRKIKSEKTFEIAAATTKVVAALVGRKMCSDGGALSSWKGK